MLFPDEGEDEVNGRSYGNSPANERLVGLRNELIQESLDMILRHSIDGRSVLSQPTTEVSHEPQTVSCVLATVPVSLQPRGGLFQKRRQNVLLPFNTTISTPTAVVFDHVSPSTIGVKPVPVTGLDSQYYAE
jgi:hypothetical protein